MSGNISLTADGWHGTQMKPDLFEPVTAEWAGRAAMNAGWLFARQQQAIFTEGQERQHVFETPAFMFQQVFRRRFWLNEGLGTFKLTFCANVGAPELILSGTLTQGFAHGWADVGTCDGTYTTSGWKALTIYTDPDWHKDAGVGGTNFRNYAQLFLWGRVTAGYQVTLHRFSLSGVPRS
jgi:hypothetical protein